MRPGMLVLTSSYLPWWKFLGLFAHAIKFFTGYDRTHAGVTCGDVCGTDSILEAKELFCPRPFKKFYEDNPTESYWIYDVTATEERKAEALRLTYKELSGSSYGTLQNAWFIYRWFMERVFNKDVRKQKNWFPGGTICSEGAFLYTWNLGGEFRTLLDLWTRETFHPGDMQFLIDTNPGLFPFVASKEVRPSKKP